ncbi:peptidase S41 [Bacteroides sp. OttesenSCG-928-D19]|nr:peptidase S41 [Bacteroides sp. OttesenSCG-928-D19]
MKFNYTLLFISVILLTSCGVDRRDEYIARNASKHWMEEVMLEHYLWYADIPESEKLNYFAQPETFFPKLLSSKDGKNGNPYSWMEKLNSDEETPTTRSTATVGYGFEVSYLSSQINRGELYARVLYTAKNSPAAEAGLTRGNWIIEINGKPITDKNRSLLTSGSGCTLSIGHLNEDTTPEITGTITLPAARSVINNPVYYYNVYERGDKTIGYLVYNSFVSGEGEEDTSYLTELVNISNAFKAANVNEFVLDLRYNLGGELNKPVPFLCSMLAPASTIGQKMGYIEYNDKNTAKNWELDFTEESLRGGSNLNLQRVFVLTWQYTASASEAVINFLEPYTDVIVIGTNTVGKNVGSEEKRSEEYALALHPIVCQLYNADHFGEYQNGFTPKYPVDESQYIQMLPLGNEKEILLSTALSLIDGTYQSSTDEEGEEEEQSETRSLFKKGLTNEGSSLEQRAFPSVMIIR